ncbi:MAG: gliding motility-associated C-terminal domain-containing protein [Crocinitomicaceae bacterium]|tara:strand:- start:6514 stop:7128 length:615 start_codon:yes stop_codon:yes gene_type:complete
MVLKLTLIIIGLIISLSNFAQTPVADFSASPLAACVGEEIAFTNASSSNGGSEIQEYVWDFGDGTSIFSESNENQATSYGVSGQYPIILTITDNIGCTDSYEVLININDPLIWVPNVFTPNGDGANDLFNLPYEGFKTFNILILNRWGNVMWDKTDQTGILLWDSTDNVSEKCKDGVYFYKLSGTMFGGTQQDLHGFVAVIDSE